MKGTKAILEPVKKNSTKLFEPKKAISCREFYQIARYYQKFHHRNRRFLSLKSFL
jgi:hypothetical protein